MKRYKCWKAVAMLLALILLFPMNSFAQGSIDLTKKVSLTISYRDGGKAIKDAEFDMYLVATVDENGTLTTTKDFAQFNVNISGKNDAQWNTLQSTLEGYVLRDNIVPTDSQKTDAHGMAYFPTAQKTLPAGLYLVMGERHTQDGTYYDASSFMVMLPTQNNNANTWDYDVTVNVKYEKQEVPEEQEVVTRKVLKVWNDKGHENERPKEIVVQLLRDGKVFETIPLNADNQWRYTWENLDDSYTWKVVEKEQAGYTVEIVKEGITFVVTNTYAGDKPAVPSSGTNTNLPQTGQLWWPVPVCLCIGLAFVIVGLVYKGNRDEK